MKQKYQQGVALVITLLMLSVITFLAVTFLAVSRRDRASVTVAQSRTDSRFMAEAALARAQTEIVARMMAQSNLLSYDMMVSKSFQNPIGFNPGLPAGDTNNVNANFSSTTKLPLTSAQNIQNAANLYFDPRVPVFVRTNSSPNSPLEPRFYLDLNRNGRFETNGFQNVLDIKGQVLTNFENFIGDPEWIGLLENPRRPHSGTNRFLGRYAYLVQPLGKTLDINYIHNYIRGSAPNVANTPAVQSMNGDRYQRSQNVGSWELNLAGFLADLNTNAYLLNALPVAGTVKYEYNVGDNSTFNRGAAFEGALSILRYRYNEAHVRSNLNTLRDVFVDSASRNRLIADNIDAYGLNPIDPATLKVPHRSLTNDQDVRYGDRPWAGADSPLQFRDLQELFDTNKVAAVPTNTFRARMQSIRNNTNSYDRYTFYRLMSQMGVGSTPELRGKINLNYTNSPDENVAPTNLISWTAVDFFTNAADAMLHTLVDSSLVKTNSSIYYFEGWAVPTNFMLSAANIPIYPTNFYSSTVHRVLQMAANLYDSTTNDTRGGVTNYGFPSVFMPILKGDGNNVAIVGYRSADNQDVQNLLSANPTVQKLLTPTDRIFDPNSESHKRRAVYGVSAVVGAKKGLPNFNEFSQETFFQMSRKLQFLRDPNSGKPPYATNQMYVCTISNRFGLEFWNSYSARLPNKLRLVFQGEFTVAVTNDKATVVLGRTTIGPTFATNFVQFQNWPGWSQKYPQQGFIVPLATNVTVFKDVRLRQNGLAVDDRITEFENDGRFPNPNLFIVTTNFLRCAILDVDQNRILDYVSLGNFGSVFSITNELAPVKRSVVTLGDQGIRSFFFPERQNNSLDERIPTAGVTNQILFATIKPTTGDNLWRDYNYNVKDAGDGAEIFRGLLSGSTTNTTTNTFYSPFEPSIGFVQTKSWQANDPLVHYTLDDLYDPRATNQVDFVYRIMKTASVFTNSNLGRVNSRYAPWGWGPDGVNQYNIAFKDPQIYRSDNWDFPTNKYPTLGWIGRVHRGTPWQTIYLKSAITNDNYNVDPYSGKTISKGSWSPQNWTNTWTYRASTYPTNDWPLIDVFTTAINDNAARGTLSVNQSGMAAWSAVLSGLIVLTNDLPDGSGSLSPNSFPHYAFRTNEPNSAQLRTIVDSINAARMHQKNQVFSHMGDVLQASALSVDSPFLNRASVQRDYGLDDAAYECIPQQILSLLRLGEPRFAIYAFGQSLKPADNSLVLSSANFQLCTNYQVTGEVATRTIVRVEGTPVSPKMVVESFEILPPYE
jgi:hypothetical protein